MSELNEPVLDNEYPVYFDYIYVVDGELYRSDIQGTVSDMKRSLKAKEVRRCDIFGRQEMMDNKD